MQEPGGEVCDGRTVEELRASLGMRIALGTSYCRVVARVSQLMQFCKQGNMFWLSTWLNVLYRCVQALVIQLAIPLLVREASWAETLKHCSGPSERSPKIRYAASHVDLLHEGVRAKA